jgi:hypothetical protein
MPAVMTAQAAVNHMWISCPNSSAPQSCWPAFAVRADGVTVGRLRRNRPGVLVTAMDTDQELYDSTAAWRDRAMAGVLHSGTPVSDQRSADRTALQPTRQPVSRRPAFPHGVAGPSGTLDRAAVSSHGVSERPGPPRRPGP